MICFFEIKVKKQGKKWREKKPLTFFKKSLMFFEKGQGFFKKGQGFFSRTFL
jgi:hypothetical protein